MLLRWLVLTLGLFGPAAVSAQVETSRTAAPVLIVNIDQLYAGSRLGQDIRAELDRLTAEAQLENDRLVAELIAEEQDLAQRRPDMDVADFRIEANAFDEKAQRIRSERDAKDRELTQARSDAEARFRELVGGAIREVMIERNGAVVLDSRTVFVALSSVDITNAVIERLDLLAAVQSTNP